MQIVGLLKGLSVMKTDDVKSGEAENRGTSPIIKTIKVANDKVNWIRQHPREDTLGYEVNDTAGAREGTLVYADWRVAA